MTELGDVLELAYLAPRRYRTIRSTLRYRFDSRRIEPAQAATKKANRASPR